MFIITRNDPNDYQELHQFDNGYGASIIRNPISGGNEYGKYELAIIVWDNGDWDFGPTIYEGKFTKGWLTLDEARRIAYEISRY